MTEPPAVSEDEHELPGLIDWGDELLDATLRAEQERVARRRLRRRRRTLPVLALIGVLAVPGALVAGRALAAPTPTSPARAAADPFKCAPDESWCVGAFLRKGHRSLDIFGFEMAGRYKVCVTPPRGRERCKSFTLVHNASGANASSVRFTTHFPHARRGRYAARWLYKGRQVGPVLRFRHPA